MHLENSVCQTTFWHLDGPWAVNSVQRVGDAEMSVCSTTFGAVVLTDEDARKFQTEMRREKRNKAAHDSYARGKKSAKQFVKSGYATLKVG